MRLKQLYVSKLFGSSKRKVSLLHHDDHPESIPDKLKDGKEATKQKKKTRTRRAGVKRSWCRRQHVAESHQVKAEVPSSEDGIRAPANSDEDDEPALVNRRCSLHSSQYSSSFDSFAFTSSSSAESSLFVSRTTSPCTSFRSSGEFSTMKLEARAKAWDCSSRVRGSERRNAVPVPVLSSNPYRDFKDSMAEMIVKHGLFRAVELQELLDSYLGLNTPASHGLIIKVFADICLSLYS